MNRAHSVTRIQVESYKLLNVPLVQGDKGSEDFLTAGQLGLKLPQGNGDNWLVPDGEKHFLDCVVFPFRHYRLPTMVNCG